MYTYTIENIPLKNIIFIFQEQGTFLSRGEILTLAESLTAVLTGFFLEKLPAMNRWKPQHTTVGQTTAHTNWSHTAPAPGHWAAPRLHQTGCQENSQADPGLYIVSCSEVMNFHCLRHRARCTSCKRPIKLARAFAVLQTSSISNTQTPTPLKLNQSFAVFSCISDEEKGEARNRVM